jgi:hypothetical protein
MSVARSVADVLRDHVVLELEAIDRMYLNVYVLQLQTVGAVVGYLRVHRGQRFASTTAVTPMTEAFVRNIEDLVSREGIDLVTFEKGPPKDAVTQGYVQRFAKSEVRALCRHGPGEGVGDAHGALGRIRGSWNPPRWSTTTISTAWTRTSGHSS